MNRVGFLVCTLIGYILGRSLPHGVLATYVPILVSYHLYLAWLLAISEEQVGVSTSKLNAIVTHAAFMAALIGLGVGRHYIPILGFIGIFVPGLAPFECKMLFSGKAAKKQTGQNEAVAATAVDVAHGTALQGADAAAHDAAPASETALVIAAEAAPQGMAAETTIDEPAAVAATAGEASAVHATAAPEAVAAMCTTGVDEGYSAEDHDAWLRYLSQPRRAFRRSGVSVGDEMKEWLAARALLRSLVAQNQHVE